jgi:ribonuclease HII
MQEAGSNPRSDLFAGMDEVGNGALAGPLCIAVVVVHKDDKMIEGVNDSKQLTRKKREALAPLIVQQATFVGVGWTSPQLIDAYGMVWAWQHAATRAIMGMPDVRKLWVDGNRGLEGYGGDQETIVRGDANLLYWWIAAASIVAKVARDLTMRQLAETYKDYGWENNVGYGSKKHYEGLRLRGPTEMHRKLFLRKFLKAELASG